MSFFPRKLLSGETDAETNECYSCPPPPPPLASPARPGKPTEKSMILLIILCVLGGLLLFLSYFTIMRFRSSLRRARRRAVAVPEIGQDFADENQGPIVDHPIWHIRTVGLPQSVIESISIFRFRKRDGLIEGSDCSICLSEFQEDEILRLLPKCSHAFHSQCIDEWLRSHKNCPVCRAPILSAAVNTVVVAVDARPPEENQAIIQLETDPEMEIDHLNGEMVANMASISIPRQEDDKPIDQNLGNLRALSDLTDHYRTAAEYVEQPQVRRSSSMVNFPPGYKHLDEGCSGSTAPATRECKNSSFHVLIKCSSNGRRSLKTTHQ